MFLLSKRTFTQRKMGISSNFFEQHLFLHGQFYKGLLQENKSIINFILMSIMTCNLMDQIIDRNIMFFLYVHWKPCISEVYYNICMSILWSLYKILLFQIPEKARVAVSLLCEQLLILSMILYREICEKGKLLKFYNCLYGKAPFTLQELNHDASSRNRLCVG